MSAEFKDETDESAPLETDDGVEPVIIGSAPGYGPFRRNKGFASFELDQAKIDALKQRMVVLNGTDAVTNTTKPKKQIRSNHDGIPVKVTDTASIFNHRVSPGGGGGGGGRSEGSGSESEGHGHGSESGDDEDDEDNSDDDDSDDDGDDDGDDDDGDDSTPPDPKPQDSGQPLNSPDSKPQDSGQPPNSPDPKPQDSGQPLNSPDPEPLTYPKPDDPIQPNLFKNEVLPLMAAYEFNKYGEDYFANCRVLLHYLIRLGVCNGNGIVPEDTSFLRGDHLKKLLESMEIDTRDMKTKDVMVAALNIELKRFATANSEDRESEKQISDAIKKHALSAVDDVAIYHDDRYYATMLEVHFDFLVHRKAYVERNEGMALNPEVFVRESLEPLLTSINVVPTTYNKDHMMDLLGKEMDKCYRSKNRTDDVFHDASAYMDEQVKKFEATAAPAKADADTKAAADAAAAAAADTAAAADADTAAAADAKADADADAAEEHPMEIYIESHNPVSADHIKPLENAYAEVNLNSKTSELTPKTLTLVTTGVTYDTASFLRPGTSWELMRPEGCAVMNYIANIKSSFSIKNKAEVDKISAQITDLYKRSNNGFQVHIEWTANNRSHRSGVDQKHASFIVKCTMKKLTTIPASGAYTNMFDSNPKYMNDNADAADNGHNGSRESAHDTHYKSLVLFDNQANDGDNIPIHPMFYNALMNHQIVEQCIAAGFMTSNRQFVGGYFVQEHQTIHEAIEMYRTAMQLFWTVASCNAGKGIMMKEDEFWNFWKKIHGNRGGFPLLKET